MKFFRTTFFSALITLIKIGSGFIATKIVAIHTGATGIAMVGAFANFIAIVLTFANGAINTGVIKYLAALKDNENKAGKLLSTSLRISLLCSVITGLVLILGSSYFSKLIFLNEKYQRLVVVFGVTLVFYAINSLIISIFNGKGELNKYTSVNVAGSLIGLLLTLILVTKFDVTGALYSMALAPILAALVGIVIFIRSSWFKWSFFVKKLDIGYMRRLSRFSFMAIVSAATVPVSQIILRNELSKTLGVTEAGYWQAMMRVSDGYLIIITTSLATYYLPKLSVLKSDIELQSEIFKGYKLIVPALCVGFVIIYFTRFLIIKMLFSNQFILMENLFFWQMIGDFFKICAWLLAYLMLAKAMIKKYVITEIVFSVMYVVLGQIFIHIYGLKGVTIAYFINYFIYFAVMLVFFRRLMFQVKYE